MADRLRGALSPYLRAHADNPVDWWPWGEDAFAEARRRDVPVLVSIGYATCHWCHVMARESFSDPLIAAQLRDGFVAVKVDREEHPDVDAGYLAAASAFTRNLGWPLTVFATPEGRAFYAGTYFPPRPAGGVPAFGELLDAVSQAWMGRRDEVDATATSLAGALAEASVLRPSEGGPPDAARLDAAAASLVALEDRAHGGYGGAPKFPVAPVLGFLLAHGGGAAASARRSLAAMSASPLRDAVDGGFFRYGTRVDWSEPHYERMLYDNAQLLEVAARAAVQGDGLAIGTARGIARYLLRVLRRPEGGFASAQDSESDIDGVRTEGGYYALDAAARSDQPAPALDEKVLTGWNGLAIEGLATAGALLDEPDWTEAARETATVLLERHRGPDGRLIRMSLHGEPSSARAALEDYGMLANGLLAVAIADGDPALAVEARALVDATLDAAGDAAENSGRVFAVPGGADPVLEAHGLVVEADPSEGATPSGASALAGACTTLFALTGDARYVDAARVTIARVAEPMVRQPLAFGAALRVADVLDRGPTQLVTVTASAGADDELVRATRRHGASVAVVVAEDRVAAWVDAGFELFAGRGVRDGLTTAYLCRDFTCRLPVTSASALADEP
ncbi:thioredoxin domain-containing protein [Agromyces rhizosphaerae]|uniref:Thioredoxin domain-containing protein n=1 Tax=Agromyces rhizosphaerae TaxID=88374 RepID=A0A9W6CWT5_9MICO|nr:thioredoxin domain-containing protein [Agromyces rhizosphaerae]GLI28234.1 thioredoxin domain-containing protein [Agromyces rhizosphaerae]